MESVTDKRPHRLRTIGYLHHSIVPIHMLVCLTLNFKNHRQSIFNIILHLQICNDRFILMSMSIFPPEFVYLEECEDDGDFVHAKYFHLSSKMNVSDIRSEDDSFVFDKENVAPTEKTVRVANGFSSRKLASNYFRDNDRTNLVRSNKEIRSPGLTSQRNHELFDATQISNHLQQARSKRTYSTSDSKEQFNAPFWLQKPADKAKTKLLSRRKTPLAERKQPSSAVMRLQSDPIAVKNLLNAATRTIPIARSPKHPFQTKLHNYQKQSLAFMMHVEDAGHAWEMNNSTTRGGWLCSDVGMGKSAVVLALVASRPLVPNQTTNCRRHPIKPSVIVTSASLMGQWEDECRKYVPHLVTVRFHPPSTPKGKIPSLEALIDADIIISSAAFAWGEAFPIGLDTILFHRVIMDESHLLYSRHTCANPKFAVQIPGRNR